jgi:hypothetical protein
MPVRTYRPAPVQAVQWVGESNCAEVFAFLGWEHPEDESDHSVILLDNSVTARPGHWIVKTADGTTFPVSPGVFRRDYEPADSAGGTA